MHDDDRLSKLLRELPREAPSDDFTRRVVTHAVWGTPGVLRRRDARPVALAAAALFMGGAVAAWSWPDGSGGATGADVEQLRAEVRALRQELRGLRGESRVVMVPGDASPDVFVDLGAVRQPSAVPAGVRHASTFQPVNYAH